MNDIRLYEHAYYVSIILMYADNIWYWLCSFRDHVTVCCSTFACFVLCLIVVITRSCLALWSPCWERESWLRCFSLVCGLCTVCHGLFASPFVVISVMAIPGHHPYYFFLIITKIYLYTFNPLKAPLLYRKKLGFTGVYIIFLISAQKHRCGYSLEPPWRGGSN